MHKLFLFSQQIKKQLFGLWRKSGFGIFQIFLDLIDFSELRKLENFFVP